MTYNRLFAVRRGFGDKQSDLAKHLGIATDSYNLKENGKRPFKLSEVQQIAQRYNMGANDVWEIFFDLQSHTKGHLEKEEI